MAIPKPTKPGRGVVKADDELDIDLFPGYRVPEHDYLDRLAAAVAMLEAAAVEEEAAPAPPPPAKRARAARGGGGRRGGGRRAARGRGGRAPAPVPEAVTADVGHVSSNDSIVSD